MIVPQKFKLDLNEPHQIYKNAAGKRLPGVTTICGVLDKPALRSWYADMERQGIRKFITDWYKERGLIEGVFSCLPEKWFADVKKDRAADIGTVTHARCEAFLKGMELDEGGFDAELLDKSTNGWVRFHDWWTSAGLAVLHSELQMVSEAMQVGGTADIVALAPDGALVLVDLKTSKASKWWPYPEVFAQVAAYAAMFEEVHRTAIGTIHVARIGKEEDDPGQTYTLSPAERDGGLRLFRAALEVYNVKKEICR